jgi:hypothetical protein
MNSKHTFTWFIVAVALCLFIAGYRFFERSNTGPSPEVLPGLRPHYVTSIQVSPRNLPEIYAARTNDGWVLTQPVSYPAQNAAVEALLEALQKLKTAVPITAGELSQNHDANSMGFDSPAFSLVIQSGDERREILVGNKTPPGDQVFLRVVGQDGAFVTDAAWLKYIPTMADEWRDTSLVSGKNDFDSITLTNGAKIIELHCDPVTHLWQMTQPLTARANSSYIAGALQQLQTARVSKFVTDDPNADLSVFGLQPASLDLWLGHGSNYVTAIHLGKTSTNDATQVFAKREGWSAVVNTAKQPLAPWYGEVNDFRDPYLLELTAPVAEIEMIGPGTNDFALQRTGTNGWDIAGESMPVDGDNVQNLIQVLASLQVSDFVKDVVTPADLPAYGLAAPSRQVILRSAIGDTNAVIARLLFGAVRTNEVFVQRADESFVYTIKPDDYARLLTDDGRVPGGQDWQFRERRIWNFTEGDVASITVRQKGKTMQMVHRGPNDWVLAAGSQGVINPAAVEDTAHDLGYLSAVAWMARGPNNPVGFGFKPENPSLTVTLKNGQSVEVDLGAPISEQIVYAAVTLDGERWTFIFPPDVHQLLESYLGISPSVP